MKVIGIDPSSSSAGHVVVIGDQLHEQAVWRPSRAAARARGGSRIFEYFEWLNAWLETRAVGVDLAVVEELAVMRGAKTARVLAHFEAAAIIAVKGHRLPLVRIKAGEARNMVLGMNPNTPKEAVLAELRRQRPNLKLPPKNQGGEDVADAFVLTQAVPMAVERAA